MTTATRIPLAAPRADHRCWRAGCSRFGGIVDLGDLVELELLVELVRFRERRRAR